MCYGKEFGLFGWRWREGKISRGYFVESVVLKECVLDWAVKNERKAIIKSCSDDLN